MWLSDEKKGKEYEFVKTIKVIVSYTYSRYGLKKVRSGKIQVWHASRHLKGVGPVASMLAYIEYT